MTGESLFGGRLSKDRGCVAGYASFSVSYSVCVPFVSMCNSSVEGEDGQGGNEIESSSGDMTRKTRQDKVSEQLHKVIKHGCHPMRIQTKLSPARVVEKSRIRWSNG